MSNINLGLDIDRPLDPPEESFDIGGDEPTRDDIDYILSKDDVIALLVVLGKSDDFNNTDSPRHLRVRALRERLFFATGVVIETDA